MCKGFAKMPVSRLDVIPFYSQNLPGPLTLPTGDYFIVLSRTVFRSLGPKPPWKANPLWRKCSTSIFLSSVPEKSLVKSIWYRLSPVVFRVYLCEVDLCNVIPERLLLSEKALPLFFGSGACFGFDNCNRDGYMAAFGAW